MNAPHGHPGYSPYPGPMAAAPRTGFSRGRTLPVVMACGLAMGVFAGLLIVRGTGADDQVRPGVAGGQAGAVAVTDAGAANGAGGAADAGAQVALAGAADAGPAAGAVRPAPADAAPPAGQGRATVRFEVTPVDATVLVDGARVAGGAVEVPLVEGSARVRVQARARGHRSSTQTIEVTGDRTVQIELKRAIRRPDTDRPDGPGGLIEL
jgi:hypothetical protein